MNIRYMTGGIVLILIIAAGAWYYNSTNEEVPPNTDISSENQSVLNDAEAGETRRELVAAYIREHISELSSEKAVLGGTFYVTDITWNGDVALVSYEDGHVAFQAEAKYAIEADDTVRITSFTILPPEMAPIEY